MAGLGDAVVVGLGRVLVPVGGLIGASFRSRGRAVRGDWRAGVGLGGEVGVEVALGAIGLNVGELGGAGNLRVGLGRAVRILRCC